MMIVQTGDDGAARGVVDLLAAMRRQPRCDLADPFLNTDVDGTPVEQSRTLNQHEARRLSAISCSTIALSAPSPDAGAGGCGVALQAVSSVRGSSA